MLKFWGNFVLSIHNHEGKFTKALCINSILYLDWIRKGRTPETTTEYLRGEFSCPAEGADQSRLIRWTGGGGGEATVTSQHEIHPEAYWCVQQRDPHVWGQRQQLPSPRWGLPACVWSKQRGKCKTRIWRTKVGYEWHCIDYWQNTKIWMGCCQYF